MLDEAGFTQRNRNRNARKAGPVLVAVLLAALFGIPSAEASAGGPTCTKSDADLLFAHGMQGADPANQDLPIADLMDRCQYRLHLDNETVTFRSNDYFLGGIFYWWTEAEMADFGWSRADAIADMDAVKERVLLAPVLARGRIGQFVEQPLQARPYTIYEHSVDGKRLYTHLAFITQLPVGDYVTRWEQSWQAGPYWEAGSQSMTGRLHIIPPN